MGLFNDYRKPYPFKVKRKAKALMRRGMSKGEIALRLKVNYTSIYRWVRDLTNRCSNVNSRYFLAPAEIAKKGYIVSR